MTCRSANSSSKIFECKPLIQVWPVRKALGADAEGTIVGGTMAVAAFTREVVLKEARRILGEK